jgi:hypothetical protein
MSADRACVAKQSRTATVKKLTRPAASTLRGRAIVHGPASPRTDSGLWVVAVELACRPLLCARHLPAGGAGLGYVDDDVVSDQHAARRTRQGDEWCCLLGSRTTPREQFAPSCFDVLPPPHMLGEGLQLGPCLRQAPVCIPPPGRGERELALAALPRDLLLLQALSRVQQLLVLFVPPTESIASPPNSRSLAAIWRSACSAPSVRGSTQQAPCR